MILSSSLLAFDAKNGFADWNTALQQATNAKFRRASRFSSAVLAGALTCLKNINEKNLKVYFGTANGDVQNVIDAQDSIFLEQRFPLPFSFINTLSGTSLFLLLQHLKKETLAINITHSYFAFEEILALALMEQKNNEYALIGVCDTWYQPFEKASKQLDKDACEFSSWLLLRKDKKSCVKFFANFDELTCEVKKFDCENLYFSPHFTNKEMVFLKKIATLVISNAPKVITNQSAAIICEHFLHQKNRSLFYVGKDIRGGYSFVCVYA
ncbi:MAG: hypothetical protein LBI78_05790 [Campylobacteraceae bacterium]|jgi:hypothetical protein|nr:hypothetical protein [Campylobacteraceae bacterium]